MNNNNDVIEIDLGAIFSILLDRILMIFFVGLFFALFVGGIGFAVAERIRLGPVSRIPLT